MKNRLWCFLMTTLFASVLPAMASDFDGSRALICAPVETSGCESVVGCEKGVPDEFGAPAFMRINFAKKEIVGPRQTSKIRFQELDKELDQLLLQGTELGNAWSMGISGADGKMVLTFSDSYKAFVIFGSCTPL